MTTEPQPSLLSEGDLRVADVSWTYNRPVGTHLTAPELQGWKQRIIAWQHRITSDSGSDDAVEQASLFGEPQEATPADAATACGLNPFELPQRNAEFWRGQLADSGEPALYFVVDQAGPLLLYVGETIKANQRWQGTHDCKRYILNYISAHRPHQLPVSVNIGFWPSAPKDRKARQSLESDLIYRWRSPFNKENWRFWNTPFVG